MSAILIQALDAIVAEINTGTFSQTISAVRLYKPLFDLTELSTIKVSVVPVKMEREIYKHTKTSQTVVVDICLQHKLDSDLDNDDIDGMLLLLEEIDDYLEFRTLSTMTNCGWMKSELISGSEAGYSVEHLTEFNAYTGILRVTYRIC